jgi:2-phospho-L-lactate transferase/gluconeogenesis factor (CofD/UPF0052 family)
MLNVVILNGGRGASTIIPSLLTRQRLHITSVVNAYDDGKSTGSIRRFFGMLGPSDIRKVQELMLPKDDPDHENYATLFQYRFPLDCNREDVLEQLKLFLDSESIELIGIRLNNTRVREKLKFFLAEFLKGLNIIEKTRQEQFDFTDCSLMNCLYAGAFLTSNRNIEQATKNIDQLFQLSGTVLPTSIEDKKLVAQRENGEILYSEAEIVELRSNVRIEQIYLLDQILDKSTFATIDNNEQRSYLERHHCYVGVSPGVRLALQRAEIIIYSAGTQHSSLYPTYMSAGLAESISNNHSALKVFITNIGADYETPSYKASDYILGAHHYLNLSDERNYGMEELFDVIFINQSHFKDDETYVEYDEEGFHDISIPCLVDIFESEDNPGKHNGNKVVKTILDLYEDKPFQ